jgi:hypothetical protein
MNTHCGQVFPAVDASGQALILTLLARKARLLEFALHGESDRELDAAGELRQALERAMDADESEPVEQGLEHALGKVYDAGLRMTTRLNEIAVDGILGRAKLPVLTTVLARA